MLQAYPEIKLHGIGAKEMGMDVIAEIKGGGWEVIAQTDGLVIGFAHNLAHLAEVAVEIPAETYSETDTAVADFVAEGDAEDMGTVAVAGDALAAVDAGSFGIIAGIHIVEAYTGTELEMVAVHGCQRGGEGGAHREAGGDGRGG